MKNIIEEKKISSIIISKNPFSLKIKINEQKDFLLKMEMCLKEIILIDENQNEKIEDKDINSSSFYDSQTYFCYSSEHSSYFNISEFEL